MRLPTRTRGIILGAAAIAAAPIVALAVSTAPPASHAVAARPMSVPVAANAPAAAAPLVAVIDHQIPLLRLSRPPAPPAPKPAPHRTVHRTTPRIRHRPAIHVAAPPAPSYSSGSVQGIIEAAAARWGVSGSWMISIARCESGLRPTAYNPRGPYYGLFQFLMSTFRANGGTNIWSAADQANIAAKMLAHGQAHQWTCA